MPFDLLVCSFVFTPYWLISKVKIIDHSSQPQEENVAKEVTAT